jgi:hypothetical protein
MKCSAVTAATAANKSKQRSILERCFAFYSGNDETHVLLLM